MKELFKQANDKCISTNRIRNRLEFLELFLHVLIGGCCTTLEHHVIQLSVTLLHSSDRQTLQSQVGKAFHLLPSFSPLDCDPLHMEETKVILNIFRTLSDEEDEHTMQGDGELRCRLNSFEEALEDRKHSSCELWPHGREKILCQPVAAGNDTTDERNVANQCKGNTENSLVDCATNQELPGKHCNNVTEGCQKSPDDCSLKEALQTRCRHVATDCTCTGCVCVAQIKQSVRKECGDVHWQGDSSPPSPLGQTGGLFFDNEAEWRVTEGLYSLAQPRCSSPKDASQNYLITLAHISNNPPPGSTLTRATFSPGPPTDKHIQLPAIFSSLRVLRKGMVGTAHDTLPPIRAKTDVLSDKQGDAKVQGSILKQVSNFLSREKGGDGKECEEIEDGEREEVQKEEGAKGLQGPVKPASSAEAAFDAFKAFFTPKPLKKDPAEKVDLEAVRKKIRADKDVLRTLFENKDPPDCQMNSVSIT